VGKDRDESKVPLNTVMSISDYFGEKYLKQRCDYQILKNNPSLGRQLVNLSKAVTIVNALGLNHLMKCKGEIMF
jgi:hypothetical protein